ncbi:phosphoglycerate mutase, partial [Xanthomonas oryzae pv. oryzae]
MTTATLLLPEKRRLPGTLGNTAVARALARADGHSADAG